jgi:hypothetical protein
VFDAGRVARSGALAQGAAVEEVPTRAVPVRSAQARDGAAGGASASPAQLAALAERVGPVTLAREHRLGVLEPLTPLLPGGGLRRGSVVAVASTGRGHGATALALALVAGPSAAGSWVAGVGLPSVGLAAAGELGVALGRLVLVAAPERSTWPTVVASLVDGFDVVLVDPVRGLRAPDARRLVARARERGAVLVALGGWAEAPDVRLEVTSSTWEGMGEGHGRLRARRLVVTAGGRGESARPRRAELWLPGPGGGVEVALDPPTPLRPPAPSRERTA